jgi:ABC-2 type transport system permease protein
MHELNAILVIAYRDFLKFLRDPVRIVSSLVFPIVIVAALGGSLQANLGASLGYDFVAFTLTGVLAQTLFQSAAFGIISLIEDRQNDFSQEIFVSPISRYSIVGGKIAGESIVALLQGAGIIAFGLLIGVSVSLVQFVALLPVLVAVCLLGGSLGVILVANMSNQRAANQVFPFLFLPQFFLAGVFNPIQQLPWWLDVLSRISPLRYAVDLTRGVFYAGTPEYTHTVLASPAFNLAVIAAMFGVFLVIGTWMFARGERNR